MPVRFAGRRHSARRRQATDKQNAQKSPQKSSNKDQNKPKTTTRTRSKSAPPLSSAQRAKLPPVDYDQALRKLVRASEILERSTNMENDVDKNLQEIQQKLEPTERKATKKTSCAF